VHIANNFSRKHYRMPLFGTDTICSSFHVPSEVAWCNTLIPDPVHFGLVPPPPRVEMFHPVAGVSILVCSETGVRFDIAHQAFRSPHCSYGGLHQRALQQCGKRDRSKTQSCPPKD